MAPAAEPAPTDPPNARRHPHAAHTPRADLRVDARPAPRADAGARDIPAGRGAVFWSFFGVRKGRAMAQDAVTIKPLHVVVVGLLAGAAFIATLLVIVRLVIRSAGA